MVTHTKTFEIDGGAFYSVGVIAERWARQGRPGASKQAVLTLISNRRIPASKFGGAWFVRLDHLLAFENEPHNNGRLP